MSFDNRTFEHDDGSETIKSEPKSDQASHSETQSSDGQLRAEEVTSVPYYKLFRFSDTRERLLISLGVLAAIIGGCSLPAMIVLFGNLADAFVNDATSQSEDCLDQHGEFNIALPSCQFNADNFTTSKETFYREITTFGEGASIIGKEIYKGESKADKTVHNESIMCNSTAVSVLTL